MSTTNHLNFLLNVIFIVLSFLILSCNQETDIISVKYDDQYRWAAEKLDTFFIYREKLPADLYAFSTPEDLYNFSCDPKTFFLSKDSAKIMMEGFSTNTYGIGISYDSAESKIYINDIFKGSPAEKAGILKYDTILHVNGKSISASLIDSIRQYFETGLSAQINIKRGNQILQFTIIKDEYKFPTVFIDSINSSTVYIGITDFLDETNTLGGSSQEFKNALQATLWAEHTIFDLRNNQGGSIKQCIEILGELVPPGTRIMITKERSLDAKTGKYHTVDSIYTSSGNGIAASRNMVILADSFTAGASEILISCIKINRPLVKLIGETTCGEGTGVDIFIKESDSVLVSITSTILNLPDNTSFSEKGITPDIVVKSSEAGIVALNLITDISGMAKAKTGHLRYDHGLKSNRIRKPLLIREVSLIK
jgi:carboxyl-terminal processing protease